MEANEGTRRKGRMGMTPFLHRIGVIGVLSFSGILEPISIGVHLVGGRAAILIVCEALEKVVQCLMSGALVLEGGGEG